MDFETFQHTQTIIGIELPAEFHHTFNTIKALEMCSQTMEDGSEFAPKIARMARHYGVPTDDMAPGIIEQAEEEIRHIANDNVWSVGFEDNGLIEHGVDLAARHLTAFYNCLATQIQVSLQANEVPV